MEDYVVIQKNPVFRQYIQRDSNNRVRAVSFSSPKTAVKRKATTRAAMERSGKCTRTVSNSSDDGDGEESDCSTLASNVSTDDDNNRSRVDRSILEDRSRRPKDRQYSKGKRRSRDHAPSASNTGRFSLPGTSTGERGSPPPIASSSYVSDRRHKESSRSMDHRSSSSTLPTVSSNDKDEPITKQFLVDCFF